MKRVATITLTSLLVLSACSSGEDPAHDPPPMPEGLLTSAEWRTEGRELFSRHCALCHGERGDGHGVRRNLSKPPADLTNPVWRQKAHPEAVYRTIHDGVPRSPMAAWRIFSEDEIWSLVAYTLSLAESAP